MIPVQIPNLIMVFYTMIPQNLLMGLQNFPIFSLWNHFQLFK